MLTKKLIAGLAGAAVVAGTLAASIASASAHDAPTIYRHSPHFDSRDRFNEIWDAVQSAFGRHGFFAFGERKDCEPVYARTWVLGPAGWTLKTVKVDENCDWRPFRPDW